MMQTSYRNKRLDRIGAWAAVVLILIGVLLVSFNKVSEKAESTWVELMAKSALDKANYLRQYWELHGKPPLANIGGVTVHFNEKGWVLPIDNRGENCEAWQQILVPSSSLNYAPIRVKSLQNKDKYTCYFVYKNSDSLIVIMNGDVLSIHKQEW